MRQAPHDPNNKFLFRMSIINVFTLTLPLSIVRAAASSLGSTTPLLSLANVLISLDTADGSDRPYEFSARIRKIYDVAGFNSVICWVEKKKLAVKNVHSRISQGDQHRRRVDKCSTDDDVEHNKFLITNASIFDQISAAHLIKERNAKSAPH